MNTTTSIDDSLRSLSLDYLNLLINGQAFSDVTFSVDGRLVHAHRCILAARSLFFRRFFCGPDAAPTRPNSPVIIPVNSVGYEVFLLMLQFLYSGQVSVAPQKHETHNNCGERNCWHTHCSSAVDLALDTLAAARSFGVDQLALLTQKQLATLVEKASIEDVMKVLLASRKQETQQLWNTCSHLVAKSGLPPEVLAKQLPIDLVAKIEELRLKSPSFPRTLIQHNPDDNKIGRMRRALDSSDVELVKLMVMGEGLNLNSAFALHYAVERCSREVVKALLELGAADVDYAAGPAGKSALHLAAEMVSPDMVAVLLDHHADPNVKTVDGVTPLDVLRNLTSEFLFNGAVPGLAHIEPNKLRLCLELVQSAALVISREDNNSKNNNHLYETMGDNGGGRRSGGNNSVNLNLDSKIVYPNRHPTKMDGDDDSITSGSTNQRNVNNANANAMIQHGSLFHQLHEDHQY